MKTTSLAEVITTDEVAKTSPRRSMRAIGRRSDRSDVAATGAETVPLTRGTGPGGRPRRHPALPVRYFRS